MVVELQFSGLAMATCMCLCSHCNISLEMLVVSHQNDESVTRGRDDARFQT